MLHKTYTAKLLKARFVFWVLGILAVTFMSEFARATAQAPDKITLDGEVCWLQTNPLHAYLTPSRRALLKTNYLSTGNWRRYIATWEIKDDRLMLRKVEVDFWEQPEPEAKAVKVTKDLLQSLFPNATDVEADWYSGTLVIPKGKRVNYVHMGYGSTFEKYVFVVIKDGVVVKRVDISHDEFEKYKEAQFQAYKQTLEYNKRLTSIMGVDPRMTSTMADEIIREFDTERYIQLLEGY